MADLVDRLWSGHAFSQVVDYGRCVLGYFTALGQVPDPIVDRVLVKVGWSCAELGLYEGINFLTQYIARTNDRFHYTHIARIHAAHDEFDLALSAVDCVPCSYPSLILRGTILESAARLDEAEQTFRKAIQTDANEIEGHLHLAELLRKRGRIAHARAAFAAALTTGTWFPARVHYRWAALELAVGRIDDALSQLNAARDHARQIYVDDEFAVVREDPRFRSVAGM